MSRSTIGDTWRTRAVRAGMRASPMCRQGLLFLGAVARSHVAWVPPMSDAPCSKPKHRGGAGGVSSQELSDAMDTGPQETGAPAFRLASGCPISAIYPAPLSGIRFPLSARPGGEIGRHEGLRSPCRKAYRFESDPGHQPLNEGGRRWRKNHPSYTATLYLIPPASISARALPSTSFETYFPGADFFMGTAGARIFFFLGRGISSAVRSARRTSHSRSFHLSLGIKKQGFAPG